MTATASATLIAPRADGRLSGGFLVNRAWLENAFLRAEEATTAAELELLLSAPGDRLALVDSLYLYQAETASILTRAARSRPVALLAHSLPSLIPGPAVAERLGMLENERAFLAEACGAIAPSRFMAAALARRGLDPKTVQIVHPAPVVDGRAPAPYPPHSPARSGPPRILTVANWTPAKGIDHAVRALALLATDWRWTLVGNSRSHPEYARRVRELIDARDLTDRVEIVPQKPPADLRGYYDAADLFLLPSLMESYGLVFSEAITFGLPVVGYRCAAVPEVASAAGEIASAAGEITSAAGEIASAAGEIASAAGEITSAAGALVDAGDISGLSVAIGAALERVARDHADHSGHNRIEHDDAAPTTLPDRDTSRGELGRALRALGGLSTRHEARR